MFSLSSSFLLFGLWATAQARVQFLGVGIAGGDFGCAIDGTCSTSSVQLPLSSLGGGDGQGQMEHFVQNDGVNMFRLPVSWQFLVNNNLGGTLDSSNLGKYDQVMQACLATGAHCMIDIHNFARWNGGIIGQGGPSDDDFVSLWTQLATKYAANGKVVFELMNEPHDLDVAIWAQTCQKVVTAIRGAGAATQMILLPGTNFDSAATLVSSGSADALMAIKNPDGTTDNLILDIHKYLDTDNSGTHKECMTDNIDSFTIVADYLRTAGRKGLISETGASLDSTCLAAFCAQNIFINKNSDVFVGIVGWGAGSFSTDYILSLTPSKSGNTFVDNAQMTQCLVDTWLNAQSVSSSAAASSSPTQTATAKTSTSKASSASSSAITTISLRKSINLTMGSPSTTSWKPVITLTMGNGALPTAITYDSTMVLSGAAGVASEMPTTLLVAAGTPTRASWPAQQPSGSSSSSSSNGPPKNGTDGSRTTSSSPSASGTPTLINGAVGRTAGVVGSGGLVAGAMLVALLM